MKVSLWVLMWRLSLPLLLSIGFLVILVLLLLSVRHRRCCCRCCRRRRRCCCCPRSRCSCQRCAMPKSRIGAEMLVRWCPYRPSRVRKVGGVLLLQAFDEHVFFAGVLLQDGVEARNPLRVVDAVEPHQSLRAVPRSLAKTFGVGMEDSDSRPHRPNIGGTIIWTNG